MTRNCSECKLPFQPASNNGKLCSEGCRRTRNRRWGKKQYTARRQHNIDRTRWYLVSRKYGISRDDFDRMLLDQSGRCGACGMPLFTVDIDHCHVTGAVRELLCHPCNSSIGQVGDDLTRIEALAAYLRRHAAPNLDGEQPPPPQGA
jgi:hypothetical protein